MKAKLNRAVWVCCLQASLTIWINGLCSVWVWGLCVCFCMQGIEWDFSSENIIWCIEIILTSTGFVLFVCQNIHLLLHLSICVCFSFSLVVLPFSLDLFSYNVIVCLKHVCHFSVLCYPECVSKELCLHSMSSLCEV